MTRVCQYCKVSMGEKCGRCGSLEVAVVFRDRRFSQFKCLRPGCGHKWKSGDDPETTGICELCYRQQQSALPRAA
jgi:hypothetical protein